MKGFISTLLSISLYYMTGATGVPDAEARTFLPRASPGDRLPENRQSAGAEGTLKGGNRPNCGRATSLTAVIAAMTAYRDLERSHED